MGNRAVITNDLKGIGVYVHWNGGLNSVTAFLEYCKKKGYRSPKEEPSYAFARLAQIIGNFFGGTYSVGINLCKNLDCNNGDNGVYIIDGWDIIGRKYAYDHESVNEKEIYNLLKEIDHCQPIDEQLHLWDRNYCEDHDSSSDSQNDCNKL